MKSAEERNRYARNLAETYDIKPRKVSYAFAKRTLDIVASLFLLILLSPLFLIVALIIKLTSKGPVFYRSYRVGLAGKPFLFYKFRTMEDGADKLLSTLLANKKNKDCPIFKFENDPRVTPVGRFLRKYSIDELPQFFNVLLGTLSLVGPRPPVPPEALKFIENDLKAKEIFTIKPGLTCYAPIMGRSILNSQNRLELDLNYINEMSFWTDLKIILQTVIIVFKAEGAH